MSRKIGEHYDANGMRETWFDNGDGSITIRRTQDAEHVKDRVAAINLGGAPSVDGLGRAVGEVPQIVAMKYCEERGIPWEKFLYSNEYDAEWPRMLAEHRRLQFENHRKVKAS